MKNTRFSTTLFAAAALAIVSIMLGFVVGIVASHQWQVSIFEGAMLNQGDRSNEELNMLKDGISSRALWRSLTRGEKFLYIEISQHICESRFFYNTWDHWTEWKKHPTEDNWSTIVPIEHLKRFSDQGMKLMLQSSPIEDALKFVDEKNGDYAYIPLMTVAALTACGDYDRLLEALNDSYRQEGWKVAK